MTKTEAPTTAGVNETVDTVNGHSVIVPITRNTPGAPNAALAEAPPKPGDGVDPRHPLAAGLRVVDAEQGVVSVSTRRKFAICGFASSTRQYILDRCARSDWEIWGLNQLYRHIPRADRWFDIHHNWDQEVVPGTDYRGWAASIGIPFYMLARVPEVPTAVRYPVERIIARLGADYFTSTIAYMTALAIHEIDLRVEAELRRLFAEPRESDNLLTDISNLYNSYTIGIYGVDLTVGSEYFQEKPCAEFWIGQAVARNIRMEIPPESALCKQQGRYGYDLAQRTVLTPKEVEKHQDKLKAERDEQFKRLMMLEGAIECDEMWKQMIDLRLRGTVVEV